MEAVLVNPKDNSVVYMAIVMVFVAILVAVFGPPWGTRFMFAILSITLAVVLAEFGIAREFHRSRALKQARENVSVVGKTIVRWKDIRDNENEDEENRRYNEILEKFKELLRADPNVDFRQFAEPLKIQVISQSGKDEPREATGVQVAESLEVPYSRRNRHVFILGKTGTGKSTLMLQMIRQDIANGKGVALVETGDLARDVLGYIPEARQRDVVHLDFETPVPIDVFDLRNEEETDTLAEDVIVTFKRFFESGQWGQGMDTILRMTTHALAAYPQSTFLDIYEFLSNDRFRKEVVLPNVTNDRIVRFWREQFPGNSTYKASVTAINSRMSKFITSSVLSKILGTKVGAIDFEDIVQGSKILLVNVKPGEAGMVVGSLIVSKIQQIAMNRRVRTPFYLYADEFQNYVTSAFNMIFTEARKYELCLTLATQLLSNVPDRIEANIHQAGTQIFFASDEGNRVKNKLGLIEPKDLANLRRYEAVVWMGGTPGRIHTLPPPLPLSPNFAPRRTAVSSHAQPAKTNNSTQRVAQDFDDEVRPSAETSD